MCSVLINANDDWERGVQISPFVLVTFCSTTKSLSLAISDCCTADFSPRQSVNQLHNNQKITNLRNWPTLHNEAAAFVHYSPLFGFHSAAPPPQQTSFLQNMTVAFSDSHPTLYVVHGRAKSILCWPNIIEPNLFHRGETTYRDGWLSENATVML